MSAVTCSVVIPCYNGAQYLVEALESVARQTRPPLEVLVVDDGSTDGSRELAASQGARVIATPGRRGPSHARNQGIRAARGDVVAFLDADDWWEPHHWADLAGLLDRYPEAIVAFARAVAFGAINKPLGHPLPDSVPHEMFRELVTRNALVQSGAAARRDALLAVGGYREDLRYAEDLDLWLRLARQGPFVASNAFTVHYRTHSAQAMQDTRQLAKDVWLVRARVWQEVVENETPVTQREMQSLLVDAWDAHLRSAWRERDSGTFRTVLALRDLVPGSDAVYRRWFWRARLLRGPWRAAAAVWDVLPARIRQSLGSIKNVVRI